jgi:hypothetical protein
MTTSDGLPVSNFNGLLCVENTLAYTKHPRLAQWMRGQTGLGPVDGKFYVYLWDYERFLEGHPITD